MSTIEARLDSLVKSIEHKVIAWRRDIHQHPELGNREFRTSALVEKHLRGLGLEVKSKVAHTGVVGILRGGKPGHVVALRADMDALPVTEMVDLPFASKVRSTFEDLPCGVMHACGHDAHTAALMGVAEVLSQFRSEIPGTVKFIFQPAEEMPPEGEEGGAALMIKEGVLDDPSVDAIFGLHVTAHIPTNIIGYRSGPLMASTDILKVEIVGKQSHAATPWQGTDPVVVSSQVVLGLQTIISRQINISNVPSVVTVSTVHGGIRYNIIPDSVKLSGTIRTFSEETRDDIHRRVEDTCNGIARAGGARADVKIARGYDVTSNDEKLTEWSVPILKKFGGAENVFVCPYITGAEDFSFFQKKVPGLFFFVGCTPRDVDIKTVGSNHSPLFYLDETCLPVCVKLLAGLAVSYLSDNAKKAKL